MKRERSLMIPSLITAVLFNSCIESSGSSDDGNDDVRKVYSSLDDCKKEWSGNNDCEVIKNDDGTDSYYSPWFYGAAGLVGGVVASQLMTRKGHVMPTNDYVNKREDERRSFHATGAGSSRVMSPSVFSKASVASPVRSSFGSSAIKTGGFGSTAKSHAVSSSKSSITSGG